MTFTRSAWLGWLVAIFVVLALKRPRLLMYAVRRETQAREKLNQLWQEASPADRVRITDAAEESGLDYGYAFALVNIAWAPGQAGGSAVGAAVASATSDAVAYLALAAICLATFVLLARYRETTAPLAAER